MLVLAISAWVVDFCLSAHEPTLARNQSSQVDVISVIHILDRAYGLIYTTCAHIHDMCSYTRHVLISTTCAHMTTRRWLIYPVKKLYTDLYNTARLFPPLKINLFYILSGIWYYLSCVTN